MIVWQLAELLLLGVVLVQLGFRLVQGAPKRSVMDFGDSLSQFMAQIGRFGTFHSEIKPWPFTDWPAPREPQCATEPATAPAPAPDARPRP
ncbi:hypothetical protein D3C77_604700 [compost metagenome]